MKKIRKIMAAVMAVATMAVSVSGLSASAYSPTITKTFGGSATATLYADYSYASSTTSCSGVTCYATLSYAGGYDSANSRGYAQAYLNGNGASKSASSTHTASGKGSTSLSC